MLKLYIGNKFTGITVQQDDKWPTMWRIRWADSQVSDMVNLSRAKDAAIPRNLGGKQTKLVYWQDTRVRIDE